jgi:hypothetical protein
MPAAARAAGPGFMEVFGVQLAPQGGRLQHGATRAASTSIAQVACYGTRNGTGAVSFGSLQQSFTA